MASTKREAYARIAELNTQLLAIDEQYRKDTLPITKERVQLMRAYGIAGVDLTDTTADDVRDTDENWESSWEESSC